MMNRGNHSVFQKLFLMFLLVMTPLVAIGINIYNWGVRAIDEEIDKSMIAQINFYLEGLEKEVQRVKLLQNEMIADDDLNDLLFAYPLMDNFRKYQAMLNFQQRLIALKKAW